MSRHPWACPGRRDLERARGTLSGNYTVFTNQQTGSQVTVIDPTGSAVRPAPAVAGGSQQTLVQTRAPSLATLMANAPPTLAYGPPPTVRQGQVDTGNRQPLMVAPPPVAAGLTAGQQAALGAFGVLLALATGGAALAGAVAYARRRH